MIINVKIGITNWYLKVTNLLDTITQNVIIVITTFLLIKNVILDGAVQFARILFTAKNALNLN